MTTEATHWYDDPWTAGDRFRKAREHTGLDQDAFADLIGASRNTISNYETNAVARHIRAIVNAWAIATSTSPEWLLTGNGDPTGPGSPRTGDTGQLLTFRLAA